MRRFPELDALRAIAAIAIVAYHYSYRSALHERVLYAGSIAMELFFVLSGYLINAIILAHSGGRGFLGSFYARRALRIWPAYYATVLAATALIVAIPALGQLDVLPRFLTFTQFIELYGDGSRPPALLTFSLGPTWSLAVEEQFYLLWPLLIALAGRRMVVPLALAFVALGVFGRAAGFDGKLLLTRCDGFAIGALLAAGLAGGPAAGGRTEGVFKGLGLACLAFQFALKPILGLGPFVPLPGGWRAADQLVNNAGFACLIGLAVIRSGSPGWALLRARWLGYLGAISFGLYLYHLPAFVVAEAVGRRAGVARWLTAGLIAPALTLAVAAASWRFLERPCLGLKRFFRYGGGPGPRASAVAADPPLSADRPLAEGRGSR